MSGRNGADNKGGTGPGNQGGARFDTAKRITVIRKVGVDGFGGRVECIGSGVVVVVQVEWFHWVGVHDDVIWTQKLLKRYERARIDRTNDAIIAAWGVRDRPI